MGTSSTGRRVARALARGWPWALAFTWLPLLVLVTLSGLPTRPSEVEGFAFCVLCGDRGLADFVLNVVFFLPLGLLTARRLGAPGAALLGLVTSIGIEVAQLTIPGRYSTLSDVLSNTTGAFLGATLYQHLRAIARGARIRPAVGVAAAVAVGASVCLGGWLLAPSPTEGPFWGQRTPRFGGTRYEGTVVDASFNGHPFPSRRLHDDVDVRGALARGEWTLAGTVTKAPAPRGLTSVLSIFDGEEEEILYLGAYRADLLLRERLRAQDWQLERPELVAYGMLADAAVGDTIRLRARTDGDERCIARDGREVCGLGFTPGRLAGLLLRLGGPPGTRRFHDAVTLVALFLPLGLVASGWGEAARNGAIAAGLIAVAIATTRLTLDLQVEPAAALFGLMAGRAASAGLRWVGRSGRAEGRAS